jgi:glycolate oxidase iron-sulfur subunit
MSNKEGKQAAQPNAASTKRCAKCGACAPVCPVYRASGNEIYSARGKQHLAEVYADAQPSPVFEDIYSKCLLCGACSAACPRDLDITEAVIDARSSFSPFYGEHGYQKYLARKALNRPELLGGARVLGKAAADILFGRLPANSGLRLRLALFAGSAVSADLLPQQVPGIEERSPGTTTASTVLSYFPGCAASYLYPAIIDDIRALLQPYNTDLQVPPGLSCCGLATMASGNRDEARRLARKNIKALELSDGPILVSCGSCFAQLADYQRLLADDPDWQMRADLVSERVVEITVFVEALLREEDTPRLPAETADKTLRVFYHDPCHMRYDASITEEPRAVLQRFPQVELLELEDGPQCCGQGGLFHLGAPELSARIRDDLATKIVALKPDVITTSCSGCLMQLKSAMAALERTIPVLHFSALVKLCRDGGNPNSGSFPKRVSR